MSASAYCFSLVIPLCYICILHSGADITARDNNEMMPLMLAIQNGKAEIVSVMLDLGFDIHAEAKNDKSIIVWAIEKEYTSLVKVLCITSQDILLIFSISVRLLLREARKLLHNLWMMRKTHSYMWQQSQAL